MPSATTSPAALDGGRNLVLFAEGTSSDGNRVLPFKSALFSAAQNEVNGRSVTVQPVTIAYTRLDGMPLGRALAAAGRLVRRHGHARRMSGSCSASAG